VLLASAATLQLYVANYTSTYGTTTTGRTAPWAASAGKP
jgi:hypothetical protein